ncbi:MAG TPA: hypothetical protein VGO29_12010 [Solirubrobacteraceae bacterium]|jgi:hypothetical protein|nr:hypothetical protein [Solirubrobacteraceae bacterium]
MALARYVVDAVLLEGRSAREVAAAHGISKSWIYVLIFRAGRYEALQEGLERQAQEFGYVLQICEVTQNTKRGARGFILRPRQLRATRPRAGCCPTRQPSCSGSV